MSPRGNLSPMPPNPMGPPFLPMEYPTYPMYPYDPYMGPDPILGPEMAFLPGAHHPNPEFLHREYLHPDYPLEYPLDYGHGGPIPGPHPGVMPGVWGPHGRHLDDWPPPSPEQAQQLIHHVVRNPSRSSADDDDTTLGKSLQPGVNPRSGHRLTSVGHSDSSGRSSPTDLRSRPIGRKSSGVREDFRVGDPVMERDPRGHMKQTTQLPHFSSGKDSGFEEAPIVEEMGTLSGRTGTAGRGGGGGGFIVSGVFNDSSKMYIPAPPSPTPDYDDDDDEDTDGNESDILNGSQFYVVGTEEYGNLPAHIKKKKLAARDSLSDDSLQGANMNKSKQVPIQKPGTPLQNMMHEFHQGLPPPDQEEHGFSDDSLEDLTSSPSRPSTVSQKNIRQNSLESLASMESSTASFDYISTGQVRNANYGKFRSRANSNGNNNGKNDKKDLNGKVKTSSPKTPESEAFFISLDDNTVSPENGNKSSGKFNRQGSKESPQNGGSNQIKRGDSFEKVRHMLKEGLIEGLDEKPPEFVPPPPLKRASNGNHSEDRADSGMGSTASTTRTDESGGSDNHSEHSGTPTSLVSPRTQDANRTPLERGRLKETVRSISSMASEDMERNRDESEEVEVTVRHTIATESPPLPPPREESLTRLTSRISSSTPPVSNRRISNTPKESPNSRLQNTPVNNRLPSTPSSSRNSSWLHSKSKDEMLELASNRSLEFSGDKVTHVDDLYGRQVAHKKESMSTNNGSIASNYSNPDPDNPLTDREFLENLKNLEPRPRPDTLAVISEDQGSVGSRGSRTGRLLSRLSDSVRSGSRTPTPSSSTSSASKATTQKLNSSSRSSTRIHGDIIREPWRASLRESALPSPQDFGRLPSLSPSAVPLSRDGSGRFRSIEDLAEQYNSSSLQQQQESLLSSKKKKHSTLPPNLTPADMKKENKELRRATSLMCGKKGKDEGESSKFRFNFFRGFWRRKQYSFDNKV
ncbi:unnamed protein product [Meganyctiphanes norvegica]|uniref:Uncharacterized protein n=1 Tax=Meganyctiphanes norvegica TaxID=48144 RepID=A0AAV2QAX1_MEGNR